jgi:hypothetical protein
VFAVARWPLERERIYLDCGRRTTQHMRDSLGSKRVMDFPRRNNSGARRPFVYGGLAFACAACAPASPPTRTHLVCGETSSAFLDTGSIAIKLDRAAASTLHSLDLAVGPGSARRDRAPEHVSISCPSKADSVQLSLSGRWTKVPVISYSVPVHTRLTVTTPHGLVLDTLLDTRDNAYQHVSWPSDR